MTRWNMVTCLAIILMVSVLVAENGSKWTGKKVLIVGDCLVGDGSGLEAKLRELFQIGGADVQTMARDNGRAGLWAKSLALKERLTLWEPHVVVVVLGLNSSRSPPERYSRHVRALSERLGDTRECYWIGPPLLVEGAAEFAISLPKAVQENSQPSPLSSAFHCPLIYGKVQPVNRKLVTVHRKSQAGIAGASEFRRATYTCRPKQNEPEPPW